MTAVVGVRGALRSAATCAWTAGMISLAFGRDALRGRHGSIREMTPTWARGVTSISGADLCSFGGDDLDPRQTYLFMSNHASLLDIAALFVALPIQPGFLAKKELRSVPFLGPAMRSGGHVFIDRARRTDAHRTIEEAARQVREGSSIVVFPEGTRGDGDRVRPFKKGGFHLARKAAVPIVPVGIRGTAQVLGRQGVTMRPGPVEVYIGRPISPAEVVGSPLEALVERVRIEVAALAALPLA